MLRACSLVCCVVFALFASLPAYAEYYVLGAFCSTCGNPSSQNLLFDDGLHQDSAAGDGLFGADIVIDRPAGSYQWIVGSTPDFGFPGTIWPDCPCSTPISVYARLWTTGPGDVVHFTFDRRSSPFGSWIPSRNSVATDHALPSPPAFTVGIDFEYDPRISPPQITAPATRSGSIWEAIVLIPIARSHPYAFYSTGVIFMLTYNGACTTQGCSPGEQPTGRFTTTQANSYVRLQFDEALGRMRSEVLGPTPVPNRSWGTIKTLYR
jgi:hypothetical protein